MDLARFKQSLDDPTPPAQLSAELRALWHAAKGGWDAAHQLVQNESGAAAAWVHAYLHRVEGDMSNAGYWYHRAGKPRSAGPLAEEWAEIAAALLPSAPA